MTEQDHADLRALAATWRQQTGHVYPRCADDLDRWLAAHPTRKTVPTVCAACEEPLPTEAEIDAAWAEDKRALNTELESRAQLACKIGLRPGNDWEQIHARIDAMLAAHPASEGWPTAPEAPHLREDYAECWQSGWRAGWAAAAEGWQPIDTAPRNDEVFFWVRPKTPEEAYVNTSGDSIFSVHSPRLHRGKFGTWSLLETATHWRPMFQPPSAAVPPAEPAPPTPECCCGDHGTGYFCMQCPIHGIKPPAGEPAPAPAPRPAETMQKQIADLRDEVVGLRDGIAVAKLRAEHDERQLAEAQAHAAQYDDARQTEIAAHAETKCQLAARDAQLGALREAAQLKRNTRIADCYDFKGEWVCVPAEDFKRLRAALAAGGLEPAQEQRES